MEKKINGFVGITIVILVFIGIILLILFGGDKVSPKTHVYNVDMVIVQMNFESKLTDDKFHKPQLCNAILFETVKVYDGNKLYREINTCNIDVFSDIHIDTKWLYNHQIGDTVHFDYLLKSEFFTINKR